MRYYKEYYYNFIMKQLHDIQTHLTKQQKEAVGLLSIGTFLEYFDCAI